jgi:hypothetical protein
MPKYKVEASYVSYCTAEIEADSMDEAITIANEMDGESFEPRPDISNDSWNIDDVLEIVE